jgi:hypothetical protein
MYLGCNKIPDNLTISIMSDNVPPAEQQGTSRADEAEYLRPYMYGEDAPNNKILKFFN